MVVQLIQGVFNFWLSLSPAQKALSSWGAQTVVVSEPSSGSIQILGLSAHVKSEPISLSIQLLVEFEPNLGGTQQLGLSAPGRI